jgi:hypothetical protein
MQTVAKIAFKAAPARAASHRRSRAQHVVCARQADEQAPLVGGRGW